MLKDAHGDADDCGSRRPSGYAWAKGALQRAPPPLGLAGAPICPELGTAAQSHETCSLVFAPVPTAQHIAQTCN